VWHLVAARYLEEGVGFMEKLVSSSTEPVATVQKERPQAHKESFNLYNIVRDNCSCYSCYRALAKNDRYPWRVETAGSMVFMQSAKHGEYAVPDDCGVTKVLVDFKGEQGYVYEARGTVADQVRLQNMKISTYKLKLQQEKDASAAQAAKQSSCMQSVNQSEKQVKFCQKGVETKEKEVAKKRNELIKTLVFECQGDCRLYSGDYHHYYNNNYELLKRKCKSCIPSKRHNVKVVDSVAYNSAYERYQASLSALWKLQGDLDAAEDTLEKARYQYDTVLNEGRMDVLSIPAN